MASRHAIDVNIEHIHLLRKKCIIMDPITSSDIVGEEFGEKFLSSLSLSAGAVAQKLNDVACYVDSTFA